MQRNCRQELDFLGMTGERIMSPVFKPGDYYYAYVEDIEEGIVKYMFQKKCGMQIIYNIV